MSLSNLFSILKGGVGSGNIGHAGIPGKRGGSAPKGVTSLEEVWFTNLTSTEKDALLKYVNAGSSGINSQLREGKISDEDFLKSLDSAINKAPKSDGNTYLYRATFPNTLVSDKGYISAMKDKKDAETYATNGRIVKKFKVPKGIPVAPISLIYRQWIPDAGSKEVLLPRGLTVEE